MTRLVARAVLLLALLSATSSALGAERFQTGSLSDRWAEARSSMSADETWVGWSIDRWADPDGYSFSGGWNYGGHRFALWGRPLSMRLGADDALAADYTGPAPHPEWERRPLAVLLRTSKEGTISRVITSDFQVPVNLGSLPLSWLGRHRPETSVAMLVDQLSAARQVGRGRLRESLIRAIALHSHPAAFAVLKDIAVNGNDAELREAATEGLPWQDHPAALQVLQKLIEDDPARDVKRTAVEALGELPEAEGLPMLAKIAHTHKDRDLGEEAIETLGDLGRRQPRAREALLRLLTFHKS